MFSKITLKNVFQNHFEKCFPKQFQILPSKIVEFSENVFQKVNFLKNRIRKILEYKWKKINIKTTFKSILENGSRSMFRKRWGTGQIHSSGLIPGRMRLLCVSGLGACLIWWRLNYVRWVRCFHRGGWGDLGVAEAAEGVRRGYGGASIFTS
jgi:hypothetical protein